MTIFDNWCALKNVQAFPARPADIAEFISECGQLGIEKIWPVMVEIAAAHDKAGMSNPTLSKWVTSAVNEVSRLEAPRSWKRSTRDRFHELPFDLQNYVLERAAQCDAAVRRAQQDAATTRNERNGKINSTDTPRKNSGGPSRDRRPNRSVRRADGNSNPAAEAGTSA